jgi:hypothetical protein
VTRVRRRPLVALTLVAAAALPQPGCAALRDVEWGDVACAFAGVVALGALLWLDAGDDFWDEDASACRPRRCQ